MIGINHYDSSLIWFIPQCPYSSFFCATYLQIVMLSDKNNDGRFCKVETKMLVLKISLQLQEYGVEFD